ncbi:MAG: cyclic nucleotide-binding domain-containing protein [Elusimicrobia bacterium]|nr:cyclic nucleotide-binding domain-containing protein [Elusimicrobiota bacterium]
MKILIQGLAAGPDADAFVAALRDVEFFQTLTDAQLREVLCFTKAVEFEAGETVFKKDAEGSEFYLVRSGRAEARFPGFFAPKVIGTMGPGEFFGEIALIRDRPRAATVVCVEPTVCLVLASIDFAIMLERHPDIAAEVQAVARKRSGG